MLLVVRFGASSPRQINYPLRSSFEATYRIKGEILVGDASLQMHCHVSIQDPRGSRFRWEEREMVNFAYVSKCTSPHSMVWGISSSCLTDIHLRLLLVREQERNIRERCNRVIKK